MNKSVIKMGLKPLVSNKTKILILGTAPGEVSLKENKYYQSDELIWKIFSKVLGKEITRKYQKRELQETQIGLWDVAKKFKRNGSSDKKLQIIDFNNFKRLFQKYPAINFVVFGNKKARKVFHQKNGKLLENRGIKECLLPSTSGVNTHLNPKKKIDCWVKCLSKFVNQKQCVCLNKPCC